MAFEKVINFSGAWLLSPIAVSQTILVLFGLNFVLHKSLFSKGATTEGIGGQAGASFQLFLGGPIFFIFFNATGLLKNWKKQHFICSNLTLFIVAFFLSFFFSLFFSFFFFFFLFFFFSFSLGGGRRPPQPPSNDAPGVRTPSISIDPQF